MRKEQLFGVSYTDKQMDTHKPVLVTALPHHQAAALLGLTSVSPDEGSSWYRLLSGVTGSPLTPTLVSLPVEGPTLVPTSFSWSSLSLEGLIPTWPRSQQLQAEMSLSGITCSSRSQLLLPLMIGEARISLPEFYARVLISERHTPLVGISDGLGNWSKIETLTTFWVTM